MLLQKSPLSTRRVISLDGIRGLAILAVVMNHSVWPIGSVGTAQPIAKWFYSLGWAGVDLFFVLSGFLITGILLDSRGAGNYFRSFYARRALRIFPLYYAFLLAGFTVFPWLIAADWLPVKSDRWMYLCYVTNWLALWHGRWRHSVLSHLWSLAVEEQFYFCWPLLVWVLRPAILLPALLAAEAAVIGGRVWWVMAHGASVAVSLATVTRMDGLLLGAVCAILVRHWRIPDRLVRLMPKLAGMGLTIYVVLALRFGGSQAFNQTAGFPLLAFSFALSVLYAVLTDGIASPAQSFLCWRPLTNVGKYAYGIYVYHVPILVFGDLLIAKYVPPAVRASTWFGYASIAILFVVSYQVAKLSFTRFERRFLNWKDRFAVRYRSPAIPSLSAIPAIVVPEVLVGSILVSPEA
jgi:peptidoglycan/LPS O-acetylase OafA/YrhL